METPDRYTAQLAKLGISTYSMYVPGMPGEIIELELFLVFVEKKIENGPFVLVVAVDAIMISLKMHPCRKQ